MNQPPNHLRWIPASVANILDGNGIRTRDELAQHLGLGRATIYRVFDADWSGTATMAVLVRMAYAFNTPLASLVVEPMTRRSRKAA